ncbi:MAG: tail fiber domain-containing protein [Bdellovibrionaceae bacterium]|nr:tail fiber domain-containing protein [Pseudobdellovibrionaceae bacterium]
MTGPLVNNSNSASTALAITQSGAGYGATIEGGNVGIGTSTPSSLLTIKAATTGEHMAIKNSANNSVFTFGSTAAGNHGLLSVNTGTGVESVTMRGDHNSGAYIFVDAQRNKPDGGANGYGAGLAIKSPFVVNQENGIFFLNGPVLSDKAGAAVTFYTSDIGDYGRGGLKFKTTASGSVATRMTIDPTGNVGIGTAVPTSKLHVFDGIAAAGTAAPSVLQVIGGTNAVDAPGANPAGGIIISSANGGGTNFNLGGNVDISAGYGGNGGNVTLSAGKYQGALATTPSQLTLGGSGSVTSGAATLGSGYTNFVAASSGSLSLFTPNAYSSYGRGGNISIMAGNGSTGVSGGASDFGGTISITAGNGGVQQNLAGSNVVINPGAGGGTGASGNIILGNLQGNVGVGTTTPGAKLDVTDTSTTTSAIVVPRAANFTGTSLNGMIRYNTSSTLFEFYQNGTWVNYTTVSDGRLKTNVTPVDQGLEIVNQLNPVFYDWERSNPKASSFENKHQVGFIAQEVEEVLPEVVNKGEDGYRSLEYGKIVSVVVAAVKELYAKVMGHEEKIQAQDRQIASKADKTEVDAKVQKLESENEKLKQENDAIKARLEKIEKALNSK